MIPSRTSLPFFEPVSLSLCFSLEKPYCITNIKAYVHIVLDLDHLKYNAWCQVNSLYRIWFAWSHRRLMWWPSSILLLSFDLHDNFLISAPNDPQNRMRPPMKFWINMETLFCDNKVGNHSNQQWTLLRLVIPPSLRSVSTSRRS